MNLKGAVAVLTGAGRGKGVGAATARLLAKEGCRILINCLNSKRQAEVLAKSCEELGAEVDIFIGDATQEEVCKNIAQEVDSRWGRADILVNCLGVTKAAPYEELKKLNKEDFQQLFSVNVIAPYLMVQALQDLLRASGDGVIVNISSAAGISGKGSSIAYATAKGGENTLTLALAQALSPEIRVNAVCPSFIDSSWWEGTFAGKEDKYQSLIKKIQNGNLLNRVLKPEDVAYTVLSIINNPVMTGELVRLDSGAHIGKANTRQ